MPPSGACGRRGVQALIQESGPIVGLHGVEPGHDIVERVWLQRTARRSAPPWKELAEIVERLRPLLSWRISTSASSQISEPSAIIIDAAAQALIIVARVVEQLRGNRRIFQRTPGAAVFVVQIRRRFGQRFAIVLGRPEAAARRQHLAQIVGEPFVDPQQVALHRRVVAAVASAGDQAGGAPVLAVPGMDELVRQQVAAGLAAVRSRSACARRCGRRSIRGAPVRSAPRDR